MLTSDLVPVRRKDGELRLTPIVGKVRRHHVELAEQVAEVAAQATGVSREQLQAELATIARTPAETRIVRGYAKLIEDAMEFEQDRGRGAAERRERLFERAAQTWQSLQEDERFDRERVLTDVASNCGVDPEQFESELFVDLPGAQRVIRSTNWQADELVERYDQARIAAVLLRALEVRVIFHVRSALAIRDLFRVLKFRQLLFEVQRLQDGRYQLTLTGPYSLFESVTKYGLQLALCWPVISTLDDFELEADLRWGKTNERLRFSVRSADLAPSRIGRQIASTRTNEVEELMTALRALAGEATVVEADRILDLPGVGLCVPDICYTAPDGAAVYLEVMGYWSRQSVWRRVELVEAGLVEPVLFLISNRLRVSEDAIADSAKSALYVYRGTINPKRVQGLVSELLARRRGTPEQSSRRRNQ